MENQPTSVSTEVALRVFETRPAVVNFNYQEISDHLDSVLEKYRGLVFSDNDVADCKKTIAELRKGQKSLDEFRKATKKQLTESVTNFEFQCKVLYGKFDAVIQPLTVQQDQFELDRKEKKRAEVQGIISPLIVEYGLCGGYAYKLVLQEKYLNKGETFNAIKAELTTLAISLKAQQDKEGQERDLIKTKVELANALYALENPLISDPYVRQLSYQSVIEVEGLITLDAEKAKARQDKAAEALIAKAAEIPNVVNAAPVRVPERIITSVPAVAPNVKTITNTYEITGTEDQLSELEAYLDEFSEAKHFSWKVNDDFMN
jgi:hypothetical protein